MRDWPAAGMARVLGKGMSLAEQGALTPLLTGGRVCGSRHIGYRTVYGGSRLTRGGTLGLLELC